MGSTQEQEDYAVNVLGADRSWLDDEQPAHRVCFDEPFWIDRTEVTNAQYGLSGTYEDDDRPREDITWIEAQAFCASRSAQLPTEAEWEYAAHGPDSWIFPWGDEFDCSRGNFDDETEWSSYTVVASGCDGFDVTAPVGSFPDGDSWVGASDMSGNVWEWVADWYDRDYYATVEQGVVAPQGPDDGEDRVLRGGAFNNFVGDLRAADRNNTPPDFRGNGLGFRCARLGVTQ